MHGVCQVASMDGVCHWSLNAFERSCRCLPWEGNFR
jgi:hypothetical protein